MPLWCCSLHKVGLIISHKITRWWWNISLEPHPLPFAIWNYKYWQSPAIILYSHSYFLSPLRSWMTTSEYSRHPAISEISSFWTDISMYLFSNTYFEICRYYPKEDLSFGVQMWNYSKLVQWLRSFFLRDPHSFNRYPPFHYSASPIDATKDFPHSLQDSAVHFVNNKMYSAWPGAKLSREALTPGRHA